MSGCSLSQRLENARRDGLRAVARYGALQGAIFGPAGKPGLCRELVTDMLQGYSDEEIAEYQTKYHKQSAALLAPEIAIAREELAARVGDRLKRGGRKR